jgi:hypothetical protein
VAIRSPNIGALPPIDRREALGLLGGGFLTPLIDWRTSSPQPSPAVTTEPLHYQSLQDVGRRIASGELSPVDLTHRLLERIATVDATLKSYATITADQAIAAARVAEKEIRAGKYRGPLHGVPVGVKDLCYTKSMPPSSRGSERPVRCCSAS